MNLNETAELLRFTRDEVKIAIKEGIKLPKSETIVFLSAQIINDQYDIDEKSLDEFINMFHDEEPGRHPPTKVRRELLVEARHSCAVCQDGTVIEFHHIIEFSKVGHYDTRHMLAMCPTHHAMCTKGRIDQKAQYEYKQKLYEQKKNENDPQFIFTIGPAYFSWDDLRQIIVALHESVVEVGSDGVSKYDFTAIDIQRKNEINRLGEEYYTTVIVRHEPYFGQIRGFLRNPINSEIVELYYQVVDEIRAKIALNRNEYERFEYFLNTFIDVAVRDQIDGRSQVRRTLNILISYMYIECDIGRKQ